MQTIAILVAMDMEAAPLVRKIEGARPETAAGRKFLRGRIGRAEVVLHICGMGMRRADSGARALVEHSSPQALVLYGVSGGLTPEMALSETVIGMSSYPAFGRAGDAEATDGALADTAARVLPGARRAPLATTWGVTARKKSKTRIAQASGAVCVDMESYAVAKAARELGLPLLVIRCLSDTFEPTSLLAFAKHGAAAAEKAAAETESVIKALAEGGL